nr:MAG TPA: hypothetical protein [Caudoviricetes sp.]
MNIWLEELLKLLLLTHMMMNVYMLRIIFNLAWNIVI